MSPYSCMPAYLDFPGSQGNTGRKGQSRPVRMHAFLSFTSSSTPLEHFHKFLIMFNYPTMCNSTVTQIPNIGMCSWLFPENIKF